MREITYLTLFLVSFLLIISLVGAVPKSLNEYYSSINYSCQTDSDCVIKDVHKCCGADYYCTNANAATAPALVDELCSKEGIASTCDINIVNSCSCVNGKCEGNTNPSCKNLYWIDNTNKNCEIKQFCGAYMYLGLQTFESKEQCEKSTNNASPNNEKKTFELSNGRKAEIKVMPETASAVAIQRLGDLGFNVTLKEIGKGNETQAVYHFDAEKDAKIFGFIKKKAKIEIDVDAENDGKIISVKKPWWAFMASGI